MIKSKRKLFLRKGMDLTPMIDIVFLLVIFFMTSSSLVKIKSIKVDLPKAVASDKEIKDPIAILIDKDESIFIGNVKIPPNKVEIVLKKMVEKEQLKSIVVEGYQDISYQKIIEIMSLAKKLGVEKVSLAVTEK